MACEVDDREQEVAKLFEHARMIAFGVELGQFLVDLGARTRGIGPVEAGARGAALQFGGAFERGKRKRYSRQRTVVWRFLAFYGFQILPAWAVAGAAEDVRVA